MICLYLIFVIGGRCASLQVADERIFLSHDECPLKLQSRQQCKTVCEIAASLWRQAVSSCLCLQLKGFEKAQPSPCCLGDTIDPDAGKNFEAFDQVERQRALLGSEIKEAQTVAKTMM